MYFVRLYQELCLVITILALAGDNSSSRHINALDICEGGVLTLHLNKTASAVYDIVVTFNGKQIAESTKVETMKWDPGLSETYLRRLTLSDPNNTTVILQKLTTNDTGIYNAYVTIKDGSIESISKNVTVSVPGCNKSKTNRQRRSSGDPLNPVPIVLGVLALIAIAVITVTIVFYKRRSRTPREQEPPGSDNLIPMKDYKE